MKPPTAAQRVAADNAAMWRQVRSDPEYRNWMIECTERLIRVCEWPERVTHLREVLKRLENETIASNQSTRTRQRDGG